MEIQNENFLIAPYSAMTQTLLNNIKATNSKFLGFIDANKAGENIFSIEDISTNYDTIYILSAHAVDIYKHLIKHGVKRKSITFVGYKDNLFFKSHYLTYLYKQKKSNIINNSFKYLATKIKLAYRSKTIVMLYAIGFVDLNIKDFYLYLENNTEFTPVIITNNQRQLKLFKHAGYKIIKFLSIRFYLYSLWSKLKVFDHTPLEKETLISIINSHTIQIWHGIPLKKIGHLANYRAIEYDVVVSTSDFVTQYAFSSLYHSKKFINSGYPRNDVFLKSEHSPKELILTNMNIYDFLKNIDKKIYIYMPTWRHNESGKNPIELDKLNAFAKENNIFILIKNHPFTREGSFYTKVIDSKKYYYSEQYSENILFFPTTDDIYPILAFSHALITDYSSVYFDYLLLNKPIIFFIYDMEEYEKTHGNFMLDFEQYTPGLKAKTVTDLKRAIVTTIEKDDFIDLRENMKHKFFENTKQPSCEIITSELIKLSKM